MMKFNRNIWFLVALLSIALVSCKDDETVVSTITSFEKFSITNLPVPLVVSEADATHSITFSFDDRQVMDVHLVIAPTAASTATEGVDYDLSTHEIVIESLEKNGTFDITVYADFEPEGDETVVIHFEGTDVHGLPTPAEALVLTIRDSIYPVAVELSWEGAFIYDGDEYNLCDEIDIDLFLFDALGMFAGGFGGATGNCPERMFTGTLVDGVYDIAANFYTNGLFGAPGIDTIPIPMTVSIFKGGVVSNTATTVRYSTADFSQIPLWTAYTPSDPDGLAIVVVGQIRVGGGKVTLVDPDGNDIGSFNQ